MKLKERENVCTCVCEKERERSVTSEETIQDVVRDYFPPKRHTVDSPLDINNPLSFAFVLFGVEMNRQALKQSGVGDKPANKRGG